MSGVTDVTVKGANEVLAALRNAGREKGVPIRATIITFDSQARVMPGFNNVAIADAKSLEVYQLGGGTAIYEGLGVAIDTVVPNMKRGDQAVIALLTDGQNNTFGKYTIGAVKSLINDSKGITYAIVAANQDAHTLAKSLGIPNAVDYMSDSSGTRGAFFQIARASRRYVENIAEGKWDHEFFEPFDAEKTKMKVNGVSATVNLPESAHKEIDGLPPYAPAEAYVVDEYTDCPKSWMHGSAKASSYFVGVRENTALWFNFNENNQNDHDIAVVISVQGVNPLTGQKTGTLRLEKYDGKCPLHDKEFGQERFCADCGFKWPAQNFISTTSCENNKFWLDGFRTPDGKVRQYVFTEEMARGVANAIIGDDKVYAVGIAFYKSKQPKPVRYGYNERMLMGDGGMTRSYNHIGALFAAPPTSSTSSSRKLTRSAAKQPDRNIGVWGDDGTVANAISHRSRGTVTSGGELKSYKNISKGGVDRDATKTCCVSPKNEATKSSDFEQAISTVFSLNSVAPALADSADDTLYDMDVITEKQFADISPKSFEVAAGEAVKQEIGIDPNSMEYWGEEPIGFIYVNYTDVETVKQIVAAGKRKETTGGFLANVPVGNK
jgi:uncharacterized protein YegL